MSKDCTTGKVICRLLLLATVISVAAGNATAEQPGNTNQISQKLLLEELNLSQVSLQLKIAQARHGRLQKWIETQTVQLEDVHWGINPILAELRAKRDNFEQELHEGINLRGQMTESHPKVIGWHEQITEIDELLKTTDHEVVINRTLRTNEPRLTAERNIQQLLGEIEVLAAEKKILTAKIKQIKTANNQAIVPSTHKININVQQNANKLDQLNITANNITMVNDEIVMQERVPGIKESVNDETCNQREHGVVVQPVRGL